MKKIFALLFVFQVSIASEVNWERPNYCPTGDIAEVEKILQSMTIEEKVGQVIMADLDFVVLVYPLLVFLL